MTQTGDKRSAQNNHFLQIIQIIWIYPIGQLVATRALFANNRKNIIFSLQPKEANGNMMFPKNIQ